MFTTTLVSLVLAASALANPFFTSPVASSVFTAGQSSTVSWIDSGVGPTLSAFGAAECALCAGNALQQTELQVISASVDVSAYSSLAFTPDPSVGPESSEYFIRCTSLSGTDSKTGYHYQAFSAKFTLVGMKGKFSTAVQAQIDGQSTAPIGGSTSTTGSASSTSTGTATATTTKAATTGMTTAVTKVSTIPGTTAAAATSAVTTGTTNGAGKPAICTGFVALVATLIGASLL